jgi:hypothetical protein
MRGLEFAHEMVVAGGTCVSAGTRATESMWTISASLINVSNMAQIPDLNPDDDGQRLMAIPVNPGGSVFPRRSYSPVPKPGLRCRRSIAMDVLMRSLQCYGLISRNPPECQSKGTVSRAQTVHSEQTVRNEVVF